MVFPGYISKYPGIGINVINDDDDGSNNNNPLTLFFKIKRYYAHYALCNYLSHKTSTSVSTLI